MALLTFNFFMGALKRKSRIPVVLKQKGTPLDGLVATITGLFWLEFAELSEMNVPVASLTARLHEHEVAEYPPLLCFHERVAGDARLRQVCAGQCKPCLPVLRRTEHCRHKSILTVTLLARYRRRFSCELSEMNVLMTGFTTNILELKILNCRAISPTHFLVAGLAFLVEMLAAQRKVCLFVLFSCEKRGQETTFVVTIFTTTVLPMGELALMNVPVAILALCMRQRLHHVSTGVTFFARNVIVLAHEREIRLRVIEYSGHEHFPPIR